MRCRTWSRRVLPATRRRARAASWRRIEAAIDGLLGEATRSPRLRTARAEAEEAIEGHPADLVRLADITALHEWWPAVCTADAGRGVTEATAIAVAAAHAIGRARLAGGARAIAIPTPGCPAVRVDRTGATTLAGRTIRTTAVDASLTTVLDPVCAGWS